MTVDELAQAIVDAMAETSHHRANIEDGTLRSVMIDGHFDMIQVASLVLSQVEKSASKGSRS